MDNFYRHKVIKWRSYLSGDDCFFLRLVHTLVLGNSSWPSWSCLPSSLDFLSGNTLFIIGRCNSGLLAWVFLICFVIHVFIYVSLFFFPVRIIMHSRNYISIAYNYRCIYKASVRKKTQTLTVIIITVISWFLQWRVISYFQCFPVQCFFPNSKK